MMNPYSGKTFFQFIEIFFSRMGNLLFGKLTFSDLATDEIQVIVLALISLTSSLIGLFLVLRKMTMLANSLSHTILLGIVVAYLLSAHSISKNHEVQISFNILLLASLVTGLMTTFFTQFFTHVLKLQEDASIGLVFTTFFALGIVLVTIFTRNVHIGTEAIMGNVDALHRDDIRIVFGTFLVNFAVIGLFFNQFTLTSFDPAFSLSMKVSPHLFGYLLMVLTAAAAISAFRAVGVLLFLAFLVGPVLSARLLSNRLHTVLILAILIGMLSSFFGVALSRHFLSIYQIPLSTAGIVVTLIGVAFLGSLTIHLLQKGIPK
ncbi:MAG: metal ABC transporter permease [Chlamydiae bacterium]|nr:metal ABC transporter permease [Chlamydiota bacterium]